MANSEVVTFKVSPELKARLEIEARERGITQGAVARKALASYLEREEELTELDKEVLQREARRRLRNMMKGKPVDAHDGIMLVKQVWDVIEKEKRMLKECDLLAPEDYDSFIRLVEQNKEVARTYEDSERLIRKFDILIERLEGEKQQYGKARPTHQQN